MMIGRAVAPVNSISEASSAAESLLWFRPSDVLVAYTALADAQHYMRLNREDGEERATPLEEHPVAVKRASGGRPVQRRWRQQRLQWHK